MYDDENEEEYEYKAQNNVNESSQIAGMQRILNKMNFGEDDGGDKKKKKSSKKKNENRKRFYRIL